MDTVDALEALLEEPGERLPLVTAGEARAMLGLLPSSTRRCTRRRTSSRRSCE
jgi:hypothetical protein